MEDSGFEVVEVEVVGLAEVGELRAVLRGENGGGAATEAAVVDSRHRGVVVGEFGIDFGGSYEGRSRRRRRRREFRFFGYVGPTVVVVDVVIDGGRH